MQRRVDVIQIIFPAICVIFAIMYIMDVKGTRYETSSWGWTVGIGIFITAFLCLFLYGTKLVTLGEIRQPLFERFRTAVTKNRNAIYIFLGMILYVILLKPIGFPIVTLIFLLSSLKLLGTKNLKVLWGVGFALTLIMYVLFIVILKMPYPLGLLTK